MSHKAKLDCPDTSSDIIIVIHAQECICLASLAYLHIPQAPADSLHLTINANLQAWPYSVSLAPSLLTSKSAWVKQHWPFIFPYVANRDHLHRVPRRRLTLVKQNLPSSVFSLSPPAFFFFLALWRYNWHIALSLRYDNLLIWHNYMLQNDYHCLVS